MFLKKKKKMKIESEHKLCRKQMDNTSCTNMNTPKFIGTLDWSSGKFAFSNDSDNTVWYAPCYSDLSNVVHSLW